MSTLLRLNLDAALEALGPAREALDLRARGLRIDPDNEAAREAFEAAKAKYDDATRIWLKAFQAYEKAGGQ